MTNLEKEILEIINYEDISNYLKAKSIKSLIKQVIGEMMDEIQGVEFKDGNWTEEQNEWLDNYINKLK